MSDIQQTDIVAQNTEATRALDLLAEVARAISAATEIADTVQLRDKAASLRYLTSRLGLDRDIQNRAALACIEAERKLGAMLAGMPKATATGANQWEDRSHDDTDPPTLGELQITKMDSHRWQMMARLSPVKFDAFISELIDARRELTSGAVYQYARNAEGKGGGTSQKPLATIDTTGRNWQAAMDSQRWMWENAGAVRIIILPRKPGKDNGEALFSRQAAYPAIDPPDLPAWMNEDNTPDWLRAGGR